MTSLVGSEVTLPCEVTGNPSPLIRWTRDDRDLDLYSADELDPGLMELMNMHEGGVGGAGGGALVIPRVQLDDAATYRCVAENAAGLVSQTITLRVHGRFTTSLSLSLSLSPV